MEETDGLQAALQAAGGAAQLSSWRFRICGRMTDRRTALRPAVTVITVVPVVPVVTVVTVVTVVACGYSGYSGYSG